jgi:hypothetical protein
MKLSTTFISLALLLLLSACATPNAVKHDSAVAWKNTKQTSSEVWSGTKKVSNEAWTGTKKAVNNATAE